jgi:hypothetical protein
MVNRPLSEQSIYGGLYSAASAAGSAGRSKHIRPAIDKPTLNQTALYQEENSNA